MDRAPHPNPLPVRTGRGRRDTTPHSRSAIAPELCADHPQKKQRAQGMPGARCTHSLACKMKTSIRVSHHRFAETLGHSLRDGVNGFLRALPGDRALLPPSPADMACLNPVGPTLPPRNLTPASGRQDHTTSPSAAIVSRPRAVDRSRIQENPPCDHVARPTLPRPPHPAPNVRDDRETPLYRDGITSLYSCFYQTGKRKIFHSRAGQPKSD